MVPRPLLTVAAWLLAGTALAARAEVPEAPLLVREDFAAGADRWKPTDADAWRVSEADGSQVYELHKQSEYRPPHRSPANITLLRDVVVGDFQLDAQVRTTTRSYGHRDMCLFFGYQDPAHFYYVHLGQKADDHANQIFIVNDAPRTKISDRTTSGTAWDDQWHHVRIVRRVAEGTIEVYFDDLEEPVMMATDKTFQHGRVGLGSFDDTGQWDDVELRGVAVDE